MDNIRIGVAADILGVSVERLRRLINEGYLKEERTAGGHRTVDPLDLAEFLNSNLAFESVNLPKLSARNRFLGLVTDVKSDQIMSQVNMASGKNRIVSLMTTEAVRDLKLEKGKIALASVKASAVTVEVVDNL